MADPRLVAALAGRYRIERELGAGGMATVYLAEDVRHGRPVAVKVLRRDLAEVLGSDRFGREIRIAAQLAHPNIVPLLDSGSVETGDSPVLIPYYVMPFIDGETLRARLARGERFEPAETARLLRELADALAHSHRRGVVHRDLKPENVLLQDGHALVADFGVARAVSAAGGDAITRTGIAVGTPAYMSPEQATASADLDGRSDIYSLGCVGYEMLAGEPPFTGVNAQQVITAHLVTPPGPLDARRPDVPAGLASVVMRCLAKDPADRWQSAAELLDALGGPAANTVHVPPRRGGRRHAVLLGVLAGLAVGALWVAGARRGAQPARAERVAVLPLLDASGDTAQLFFADGVTRSLVELLTTGGVRVVGYRSVMRYRGSEQPLEAIARELNADALLVGTVARSANGIDVSVELTDAATGENRWARTYSRPAGDVLALQYEIAREIARAVQAELTPEQSARLAQDRQVDPQAYASYLLGRAQQLRWTEDGYRRSLVHFGEALARDSLFAPVWAELAMAYMNAGYSEWEPDSVWRPAVERSAARALSLDSTAVVAHIALGMLRLGDLDIAGAEREFRRAAATRPDGETLDFLAWSRARSGDAAEAVEVGARAVALEPDIAQWRSDLAWSLAGVGRRDDALAQADTSVMLDPAFADPRWLRSWIYGEMGRLDDAWAELRVAEALSGEQQDSHTAKLHVLSGDSGAARSILARRDSLRRLGEPVRYGAESVIWLALGDTSAALASLERAVGAREPTSLHFAMVHPGTAGLRKTPRYRALLTSIGVRAK